MRKITFFIAAVAVLALLGAGTWVGIRTFTPTSAVAGPDNAPVMRTGAKGLSPYDDYDIVVY
jgi:hypothetical protein